jgi:hypothetical protein
VLLEEEYMKAPESRSYLQSASTLKLDIRSSITKATEQYDHPGPQQIKAETKSNYSKQSRSA